MLNNSIQKALNKQVELEASSSQFYLSMASWSETNGLTGASNFFIPTQRRGKVSHAKTG